MENVDVLILPTAHFNKRTGEPTPEGIKRINTAAALVKNSRVKSIAIIGGKRVTGLSEAEVYALYFATHFPEEYPTVKVVQAEAMCTNRDLVAFLPELKKITPNLTIGAVSYSDHLDQIRIVLKSFGYADFTGFESGESKLYSNFVIWIIKITTKIDPKWSWLGYPLVLKSHNRINQVLANSTKTMSLNKLDR